MRHEVGQGVARTVSRLARSGSLSQCHTCLTLCNSHLTQVTEQERGRIGIGDGDGDGGGGGNGNVDGGYETRLRSEAVGSWFDFYACCFMPHCSQPPSPNLSPFYPPVALLKSAFLSKTGNCAKEPEVVCCPCRRLLQLVCTPTTLTPFYLHIKQRRWPVTWDSDSGLRTTTTMSTTTTTLATCPTWRSCINSYLISLSIFMRHIKSPFQTFILLYILTRRSINLSILPSSCSS